MTLSQIAFHFFRFEKGLWQVGQILDSRMTHRSRIFIVFCISFSSCISRQVSSRQKMMHNTHSPLEPCMDMESSWLMWYWSRGYGLWDIFLFVILFEIHLWDPLSLLCILGFTRYSASQATVWTLWLYPKQGISRSERVRGRVYDWPLYPGSNLVGSSSWYRSRVGE